jgi:hypothetical protein
MLMLLDREKGPGEEEVREVIGTGVVLATVGQLPTNKLEVEGVLAGRGQFNNSLLHKQTIPQHPKQKQQTQYHLLISFDSFSLRSALTSGKDPRSSPPLKLD